MSNIEIGDTVQRVGRGFRDMEVGDVGTVTHVSAFTIQMEEDEFEYAYSKEKFKVIEGYNTHKKELNI